MKTKVRYRPHIRLTPSPIGSFYRVFWIDSVLGVKLSPEMVPKGYRHSANAIAAHNFCAMLNMRGPIKHPEFNCQGRVRIR